jgi:hypothetical protein
MSKRLAHGRSLMSMTVEARRCWSFTVSFVLPEIVDRRVSATELLYGPALVPTPSRHAVPHWGYWQLSFLNSILDNRNLDEVDGVSCSYVHETHSSWDLTGSFGPGRERKLPSTPKQHLVPTQATEQPSTPNSKEPPSASIASCLSPLLHINRFSTVPSSSAHCTIPCPSNTPYEAA